MDGEGMKFGELIEADWEIVFKEEVTVALSNRSTTSFAATVFWSPFSEASPSGKLLEGDVST